MTRKWREEIQRLCTLHCWYLKWTRKISSSFCFSIIFIQFPSIQTHLKQPHYEKREQKQYWPCVWLLKKTKKKRKRFKTTFFGIFPPNKQHQIMKKKFFLLFPLSSGFWATKQTIPISDQTMIQWWGYRNERDQRHSLWSTLDWVIPSFLGKTSLLGMGNVGFDDRNQIKNPNRNQKCRLKWVQGVKIPKQYGMKREYECECSFRGKKLRLRYVIWHLTSFWHAANLVLVDFHFEFPSLWNNLFWIFLMLMHPIFLNK